MGSVYGLIALGYSLIYKASGLMNFAQGDTLTLGAFLGYTFYTLLGLPFGVALVLTVCVCFGFGLFMEKFVIRKLVNKNVLAIYIVLATIAVSYIIQNTTQAIWSTKMLNYPAIFGVASIKIFGVSVQTESIFCLGIALVCMVGLHFFMKYTRFGTAMRASAMDGKAAQACGINTSLSTGITWGLAAGLAALAGILLGPIYGVFISLGATIGRKGFAGAIMGGYGNMYGAMIGGILLGLIETFTSSYLSSMYKDMIAYGILLLFLFVKPTGIFNEKAVTE
ncbi:MAG: branched-chain amino acid ABC transporter permease [Ruthenibacterium sp.]